MTDIWQIQFPLNRFCLIFFLIKHFGYLMQEFHLGQLYASVIIFILLDLAVLFQVLYLCHTKLW